MSARLPALFRVHRQFVAAERASLAVSQIGKALPIGDLGDLELEVVLHRALTALGRLGDEDAGEGVNENVLVLEVFPDVAHGLVGVFLARGRSPASMP